MNKGLKIGLMILGGLIVVSGLLAAGILVDRLVINRTAAVPAAFAGRMMNRLQDGAGAPGMMQPFAGGRMMGGWGDDFRSGKNQPNSRRGGPGRDFGPGSQGFGPGMMQPGGRGNAMPGTCTAAGGCGRFLPGSQPAGEPLTLDEAKVTFESYLKSLNNADLQLGKILVFDNTAYAVVVEKSTGIGAMELAADPQTKTAFLEHGPSMMWNTKYGRMAGRGQGRWGAVPTPSADGNAMSVSAGQAAEKAQDYLDSELAGTKTGETQTFYGYYTLEVLRDGKVVGLVSVNGTTGQVFPHFWQGTLVESSAE